MIIYAITNLLNGKRYIGMTVQPLAKRWMQHRGAAKLGVDTALHAAIRKYGPKAFSIEALAHVLPGFNREVMGQIESLLIAQENTLSPNGYNMTKGGDGMPAGEDNPIFGVKRPKTSEALRRIWAASPERSAKQSARMKKVWADNPNGPVPLSIMKKGGERLAEYNRRPDVRAAQSARLLKEWAGKRREKNVQ